MSLNDYTDGSCKQFTYGEVEDFCLNIEPGSSIKDDHLKSAELINELLTEGNEDPEAKYQVEIGKISIYPNPTTESFYIISEGIPLLSAEIINLEGRRIREIQDFNLPVAVDGLHAVMYYIRMIDAEGKQQVEKLIVE